VIYEKLKISVAETKSTIRSLFVMGFVDTNEVDTFPAYLTPEGYDMARKNKTRLR
jgi:hypothetical protein